MLQARVVEVVGRVLRSVVAGRAFHECEVQPGETGVAKDAKVGVAGKQLGARLPQTGGGDRALRIREGRDESCVVRARLEHHGGAGGGAGVEVGDDAAPPGVVAASYVSTPPAQ